MNKKLKRNYIILIILLAVTVFLTFFFANIYKSKGNLVSGFYEYSNKITIEEFDEYMTENTDAIIYISDKYDLTHETFEENFKEKINELNLKNKIVFVDKNEINDKFISNLKINYGISIDLSKTPLVIVIVDKNVLQCVYIDNYSNVDDFIDYEAFE